ncbi:MAG: hypothetical protein GX843_05440, partial [Synergistaceae bacterium]|nr:hypothetical protein [Synergistaceae bacterium]
GFKGTETKRAQRDWKKNKTILSGEIQGDNNPVNNSYHVVFVPETADRTTVIDGFVITGGYAVDKPEFSGGGGLQNQGTPVIANCVFENNQARVGGGLFTWSRPSITNCVFTKNYAVEDGGGMAIHLDSPNVVDCTFSYNRASGFGGGLSYYGSKNILLKNATFINNQSLSKEGGALFMAHSKGAVVNSTFFSNSAKMGGGGIATFKSSPRIVNCTLFKNRSERKDLGHDLCTTGSSEGGGRTEVFNSILWGDEGGRIRFYTDAIPSVSYSIIMEGFPGGASVLKANPRLKNPADNGGATLTCALGEGSAALDAGGTHLAPKVDQRGMPRPAGKGIDLGAYEEQKPVYKSDAEPKKMPEFSAGPSGESKPVQKPPQKPLPGSGKPPVLRPVKPAKPGGKPALPSVKKPPGVKPPVAKPPGIKK